MPRITDLDVLEIRQLFEDALVRPSRPTSVRRCECAEKYAMRFLTF